MRILPLLAALAASAPLTTLAGDSTWLLCKGVLTAKDGTKAYLVANVLEHRASDGEHRDLEITLIKDAHVWSAHLDGAAADFQDKPAPLHIQQNKRKIFDGTAKLALGNAPAFTLDGRIDLEWGTGKGNLQKMTATLRCNELDDLAIDH